MLRFATLLFVSVGLCLAQSSAAKPPAAVDEALRTRVNQFFQLMLDAKYRQAEAFVADDSKDSYYDGQKPKYLSYELKNIEYSDDFTKAKVNMLCETVVPMPGFGGRTLKITVGSTWKVVNDEWVMYIDPVDARRTPFGQMTPGTGGPRPPGAPAVMPKDPSFAMGKVKPDRNELNLDAGESGEVTLTNTALGPMGISLIGDIPGVDVKVDRVNLNADEKAVISVITHSGAQSGTLSIRIEQTNEIIPIQINVK
jgi:hypothetical protein